MVTILFLTITKRTPKWIAKKGEMWTVFDYEHIGRNWAADDHEHSPDKNAIENCYDELEVGHSYLILSQKTNLTPDRIGGEEYARWVWVGCLEMTPAQLTRVANYHKKSRSDRATVEFANSLKCPQIDAEKFGIEF